MKEFLLAASLAFATVLILILVFYLETRQKCYDECKEKNMEVGDVCNRLLVTCKPPVIPSGEIPIFIKGE
jgi:hypothetical protein